MIIEASTESQSSRFFRCTTYFFAGTPIFPTSTLIIPVIMWWFFKDKDQNKQIFLKHIVNFEITLTACTLILLFLSTISYFVFSGFFYVLAWIAGIVNFVLCIKGLYYSYKNLPFNLPWTHEFIKT